MALVKLVKDGEYGQLELNFAAFRRYGAIEAKCKMDKDIPYLENGMLLAVDRVKNIVGYPTGDAGEVIALNYTAEHMYDERYQALKHFRLDNGTFLPRLGYIGVADKFTTNTVCYEGGTDLAIYKYGKPCTTEGFKGYIQLVEERPEGFALQVLAITEMPDGQVAVKFGGLN